MTLREHATETLRNHIADGDTVWITCRGRSTSGMSRWYDVYKVVDGYLFRYTNRVAEAIGSRYDRKREGVHVGGCGFSGSQQIGEHLSYALYGRPDALTVREF